MSDNFFKDFDTGHSANRGGGSSSTARRKPPPPPPRRTQATGTAAAAAAASSSSYYGNANAATAPPPPAAAATSSTTTTKTASRRQARPVVASRRPASGSSTGNYYNYTSSSGSHNTTTTTPNYSSSSGNPYATSRVAPSPQAHLQQQQQQQQPYSQPQQQFSQQRAPSPQQQQFSQQQQPYSQQQQPYSQQQQQSLGGVPAPASYSGGFAPPQQQQQLQQPHAMSQPQQMPPQSFQNNDDDDGLSGTMDAMPTATHRPNVFVPTMQAPTSSGTSDIDFGNEPPLLEELGINPQHIWMKTKAVVMPSARIWGHQAVRLDPSLIIDDADLAGPAVFALALGGELLLTGKIHFGYIYGFFLSGCLAMTLLINLLSPRQSVSFWTVTSVLGYALLPVNVLAALKIVVINLAHLVTLGQVLGIVTVVWSTVASTRLLETGCQLRDQRYLLAYPLAMVYSAFVLITIF